MISVKEKAQELFDKHNNYLQQEMNCIVYVENAKQCAIICVDEIIKSLEEYDDRNSTHELQNMDSSFRYWEKVKKELELL
jgi:hypothetical protein